MRLLLNHALRLASRLLWLSAELIRAALSYVLQVGRRRTEPLTAVRASWLQWSCRRVLRVFNVELQVQGPIPKSGLLVCNHLSYLDILVLGALAPAIFVAKREVKSWPLFGWFALLAGTIFVDRVRKTRVGTAAAEIETALRRSALVVLFPEGTSSGGSIVLPFKSALLEPATRDIWPLSAGWIGYELKDGDVGEEVCYWKEMTFVPHLLNLLTKQGVFTRIRISQVHRLTSGRKAMAQQLHSEVVRLKDLSACASEGQVSPSCQHPNRVS
jgi:lyso-ornithine lipid O-acyltransferase